jgi:hypothetical protein
MGRERFLGEEMGLRDYLALGKGICNGGQVGKKNV